MGKGEIADCDELLGRLEAYYRDVRGMSAGNALRMAKLQVGKPLAALVGDATPLLSRLEGGESVAEVAAAYGVTSERVYRFLVEHAPGEWAAISSAKALDQYERGDGIVEAASDQVDVSRGSQLVRSAQWRLERLLPKLYAGKQEGSGLQITVNIDRGCGGVVEVGGGSRVFDAGECGSLDGVVNGGV